MDDRRASLEKPRRGGDLSVTALYTSHVWAWGGLSCAELLATPEAKQVFGVTNAVLAVARLLRPGLTSLRHSLLHRHAMIDRLVRDARPEVVVELAAGFSRRGAAMSADPALRYVEVDLPHVVARKRELLARSEEGRRILARENLELTAGDARDGALDAWIGAPEGPLVVVAEGLFMYLEAEAQRSLWARIGASLARFPGSTFVFDLVPACEQPRPGALGRALEWLMKRFTGGKSFARDERTRDDVARELRAAGFDEVELLEPAAVAARWELPFPEVPTQVLLFVCRKAGRAALPAA